MPKNSYINLEIKMNVYRKYKIVLIICISRNDESYLAKLLF